jgi:RNA polymerase sigma-70 factor (ECF subfamily)
MSPVPLTDLLRAATPVQSTPLGDGDDIEALLAEIVREARATWPEVEVAVEEFVAYVGGRLPSDEPVSVALPKMCTRDLYLALACIRGDARALAAFESYCLEALDGALARLSVSADVLVEVKQRLRRSLLVGDGASAPVIAQFSGRGNLRAWVRVIAVREALSMVRRARRDTPLEHDLLAQQLMPKDDPELSYLKGVYRQEFKNAFAETLRSLGDREATLLRQQIIDGLSIDELGALYRVHRATAARWLEHARRRLVEGTMSLLRSRLQVQSDELDSILRLIRSQLDVSVGGLSPRRRKKR